MRKKIFTFLLALVASVGLSWAQNPSGSCGANLSWEFNPATGTLTITGSGAMTDWASATSRPWHSYQSDITSLSLPEGLTFIGRSAFQECQMTSVELPNSLLEIGRAAFCACGLTSVTIPDNVQTIGQSAFASCQNLSTITIGSGVDSIGYFAFSNLMIEPWPSRKLESVTCYATTPPTCDYDESFSELWNKDQVPLYVPAESVAAYSAAEDWNGFDVQAISGGSASSEPSETTVTWDLSDMASMGTQGGYFKAKGITLMAYGVDNGMSGDGFYGGAYFGGPFVFTTSLGKFTKIEVTNSYLYEQPAFSGEGWTLDGTNAAWEGTPAALVSLVSNFGGITQIKFTIDPNTSTPANSCGDGLTWAVNDGVLTISYDGVGTGSMDNYDDPLSMPWYGQNITSVVLPEGLISIGQNAFAFINTFSQITLPSTLQYILMNAFSGCGLTSVTIPENVKGISASAFISSSSLATVTFEPTTPPRVGGNAFEYCHNDLIIYYPCESRAQYYKDMQADIAYYHDKMNYCPAPPINLQVTELVAPASWKNDQHYLAVTDMSGFAEADSLLATEWEAPTDCNSVLIYHVVEQYGDYRMYYHYFNYGNFVESQDGLYYLSTIYSNPNIGIKTFYTAGGGSSTPEIKLNANFGGTYDFADTEAFTDNGDGTATLSNIALEAGYYYNFRVKVDGVSMSDNHEFTRENPSCVISSGSGDVYYFQADVTGNYSFTWEYATNTLTIGYPEPATGLQVVEVTSDIYDEWESNNNTFTVNALPGFQAVTYDEAMEWTEVPTSGTAVLVYRTNGDNARVIHFFNGAIMDDYDLETSFNQMYENITIFGNRIFYTAGGGSTPEPVVTNYAVSLDIAENADKVTLSAASAVEGATVTLTPAEGYQITAFTASYASAYSVRVTADPSVDVYEATPYVGALPKEFTENVTPGLNGATFHSIEGDDPFTPVPASVLEYVGMNAAKDQMTIRVNDTFSGIIRVYYTYNVQTCEWDDYSQQEICMGGTAQASVRVVCEAAGGVAPASKDDVTGAYSFTMPAGNVTITATVEAIPAVDPAVQNVIDLINAIPNPVAYNDECKDAIDAARAAYDALNADQKALVSNYSTLTDAEDAYAALIPVVTNYSISLDGITENADKVTLNKASAAEGETITLTPAAGYQITAFTASYASAYSVRVTADPNVDVYEATPYVGALPKEFTENVTPGLNGATFHSIEGDDPFTPVPASVLEYVGMNAAKDQMTIRVNDVFSGIIRVYYTYNVQTCEWDDYSQQEICMGGTAQASVRVVCEAAGGVAPASKDDVTGAYSFTMPAGNVTITATVEAIPTPAVDQAVQDVIDLIDAIGTVTYTQACKDKIDAARAAYDALNADQKALVSNYSTLTDAEDAYAALIPVVTNYSISLDGITENADKVTLNKASAAEGETITLTPAAGYQITAFTASYASAYSVRVTADPSVDVYEATPYVGALPKEFTENVTPGLNGATFHSIEGDDPFTPVPASVLEYVGMNAAKDQMTIRVNDVFSGIIRVYYTYNVQTCEWDDYSQQEICMGGTAQASVRVVCEAAGGVAPASKDDVTGAYSFTMPAGNVTITATVEAIPGGGSTPTSNPSGECGAQGDNLLWEFNPNTGVLTITGSGAMADWPGNSDRPWYDYRDQITSVSLPTGITSIGTNAFKRCINLASINIAENYPASLTTIKQEAFRYTALTSFTIPATVVTIEPDAFTESEQITDVYCYANPNNLVWMDGYCDDFNSGNKITQCHVKNCYLSLYNTKWNTGYELTDVNVTFVGDLPGDCGSSTFIDADFAINFMNDPYIVVGGGDLPEGVLVEGMPNKDINHGYHNVIITIPAKAGTYKVTLGTCGWGNGNGTIQNENGSTTYASFNQHLADNDLCYHQDPTNNIVTAIFTLPEDQNIIVACGEYTPYFSIEASSAPVGPTYLDADFAIDFMHDPYEVVGGGALPDGVTVEGSMNTGDAAHGYSSPIITIPVTAGNYLVKMGACQFSNQDGSVKNEDGTVTYATLATNTGVCYHQNPAANYVADIITIPSDQIIKVYGAQYTPFFSIEKMAAVPAFTDFEINFQSDPYNVISGAKPEGTVIAGSFHDGQHGYQNVEATVPVKAGNYRLTLGACQFGDGAGNVMSETNVELASFDQNLGENKCYHQDQANNIVSMIFTVDMDQTITIDCGTYTPYMKLEKLQDNTYYINFENADGAIGTVPGEIAIAAGESWTIPANLTLYKEGYTFAGWSDGVNTYAPGNEFFPSAHGTLHAVYTPNSVSVADASTINVKWYFGESNGAPSVTWNGAAGYLLAKGDVDGEEIDLKLDIDATSGKFHNAGRGDKWAQVNANTVFTFPSKEGAVVSVETYSGNETYVLGDGTLTCNTNDYYSYLEIVYPAPAPAPTTEEVTTNADPENPSYHYSTFFHSTQNFALTNDGTEAFVADLSGNDLVLTKIAEGTQVIPMNTAVIFRKTGSADPVVLDPTDEAGVSFSANNDLEGVDDATMVTDIAGLTLDNCYVLSGTNEYGVGFYKINGNQLKAHKAYVKYVGGGSNPAPKRMRFVFNETNTATGIDNTEAAIETQKVLENGVLYIIKNGVRYNVQGQIVK